MKYFTAKDLLWKLKQFEKNLDVLSSWDNVNYRNGVYQNAINELMLIKNGDLPLEHLHNTRSALRKAFVDIQDDLPTLDNYKIMIGTLTPACGQDYKNKQEVLTDFNNNKDFLNNTPQGTNYINKEDIVKNNCTHVMIRYAKLKKVTVVKYNSNKQQWV